MKNRWFFGHFPKTIESNVLKFRVELDFSHIVAQKNSGHSDKVVITVIYVTCTGSRDVHSTEFVFSFPKETFCGKLFGLK